MPLTFSDAVTAAQVELNYIVCFSDRFILLPENATETSYGWLIPFAQSDYRFTKEVTIGGNLPFFVDKFTGQVSRPSIIHQTFQVWLADYVKQHGYTTDCA